jgi:hypothetical protein
MLNPFHRWFYKEPRIVIPGTNKGSTWKKKGFSYGERGISQYAYYRASYSHALSAFSDHALLNMFL